MTSMRSVATAGSVSGSRLVTQNLLLGLDRGWMTGLWTVGAQRQGVLRPGGEEQHGAGRGQSRGTASQQALWGGPPSPPTTYSSPATPGPRPWHMPSCLRECPPQPPPPGLAATCSPSVSSSHCLWAVRPDPLGQVGSDLGPSLAGSTAVTLAGPREQGLPRTVVPC